MILIQLTGLSGSGKTTIANNVRDELVSLGYKVEVIDGDEYRKALCKDLGFSREDRLENIRRLGFVGQTLAKNGVIVILAAINPYEAARQAIKETSSIVRTVWIDCDLETLIARDVKGLYKRALLPKSDPDRLPNLTGVNDPYDVPENADLVIKTNEESVEESSERLLNFVLANIQIEKSEPVRRAMFVGRWQPFHNGHQWLIAQKLDKGVPVLIAVRDVVPDERNPLTTRQTVAILKNAYEGKDVEIIVIPDIESVNFGRDVGYEINEFVPPDDIKTISATEIRESINSGSDDWKGKIDERNQHLIAKYLGS
ncbi:MAG TPA: adenylyl-sulfate kinase [Pyrinomonadaceae bacterium]|nr:adenylyl-sulfate kinase [Pyrinomonadaceae bacterium]